MRTTLAALLCAAMAGCVTAPATERTLPKERASECTANCSTLGMRLSAVVIIMSHAGCVCEPVQSSGAQAPRAGGAAVAGGGMIAVIAAQQRTQQQSTTPGGAAGTGGRSPTYGGIHP